MARSKKKRRTDTGAQEALGPQEAAQRGWLPPKVALAGIALVSLFAAGNVAYALYQTTDIVTTIVVTFLALITPGLAAALTFVIRERLVGS